MKNEVYFTGALGAEALAKVAAFLPSIVQLEQDDGRVVFLIDKDNDLSL